MAYCGTTLMWIQVHYKILYTFRFLLKAVNVLAVHIFLFWCFYDSLKCILQLCQWSMLGHISAMEKLLPTSKPSFFFFQFILAFVWWDITATTKSCAYNMKWTLKRVNYFGAWSPECVGHVEGFFNIFTCVSLWWKGVNKFLANPVDKFASLQRWNFVNCRHV